MSLFLKSVPIYAQSGRTAILFFFIAAFSEYGAKKTLPIEEW